MASGGKRKGAGRKGKDLTKPFALRLSATDHAYVKAQAKSRGLSMNEYVLQLIRLYNLKL